MTEWQINIREAGLCLPEAIALRVPSVPIGFARQLCRKQRVAVDAAIGNVDRTVQYGEHICVKSSSRWLELLQRSPVHPADVLYEDTECLVINKPSGLAVHNAQGHNDNLKSRLQGYLHLRREMFRIAPVHRLDAGTSGAILFGKGKRAASQLGQELMAGGMSKRYLALVRGVVVGAGELTTPVLAKGRMKSALTRFRPIDNNGRTTLLELELVTGRQHQVRKQLAEAGWPIIGDSRYHHRSMLAAKRLLLHCRFLTYRNPISDRLIEIDSPLPEDFIAELGRLDFPTYGLSAFIPQKTAT